MINVVAIDYDPLRRAVCVGQLGEVWPQVLGRWEAQALVRCDQHQVFIPVFQHLVVYFRSGCLLENKDQVQTDSDNDTEIQAEEKASDECDKEGQKVNFWNENEDD